MHNIRLSAIYRYPIKGFGGQPLPETEFIAGKGITFDRFLGIANGHANIFTEAWSPCQGFVRMTKNDGLPLFRIDFDGIGLTISITHPDGEAVSIDLMQPGDLEAVNDRIASWFPPGRLSAPQLVRRHQDLGWWDVDDAPLSIINLETLGDLARKAGQGIDPMRFRGNLYIDQLAAWHEFALVGKRLRIGQAEIEVLRPIERCKATSIDPKNGKSTMNMPALLSRMEGHLYVGVHAKVVKSGTVRPGDAIEIVGDASSVTLAALRNPNAPAPENWPRFAAVVQRVKESDDVDSFWLQDPLMRLCTQALPGQHLRLHLQGDSDGPIWRTYTISGTDGDRLRLSIKNEGPTGKVSNQMHQRLVPGGQVCITGPFGSFHLRAPSSQPLFLVSAGIGITPMVAILRALEHREDRTRPVYVVHRANKRSKLALWSEVQALLDRLPFTRSLLFLSQLDDGNGAGETVRQGAPDATVFDDLPVRNAEVFLCGPKPFMATMRQWLGAAGTAPGSIYSETFASPSAIRAEPRPVPLPGPFKVKFARNETTVDWRGEDGSLLDLADKVGLNLAANCRAGVCGACRQSIKTGTVAHLTEPPFPLGPHEVLTCCSVPTSDVELDA
jgi:ferredoxin-NADP reductase/uncharacterized protein YcbX